MTTAEYISQVTPQDRLIRALVGRLRALDPAVESKDPDDFRKSTYGIVEGYEEWAEMDPERWDDEPPLPSYVRDNSRRFYTAIPEEITGQVIDTLEELEYFHGLIADHDELVEIRKDLRNFKRLLNEV